MTNFRQEEMILMHVVESFWRWFTIMKWTNMYGCSCGDWTSYPRLVGTVEQDMAINYLHDMLMAWSTCLISWSVSDVASILLLGPAATITL